MGRLGYGCFTQRDLDKSSVESLSDQLTLQGVSKVAPTTVSREKKKSLSKLILRDIQWLHISIIGQVLCLNTL